MPRRRRLINVGTLLAVILSGAALFSLVPMSSAQTSADGDTTSYPAVVRDEHWYFRDELSSGTAVRDYRFGPGGSAVTGDWDGDGDETPGWFEGGVWYLRNEHGLGGPPDFALRYGIRGDTPVVGDWLHDDEGSVDSLGVVRRTSRGLLWLLETKTEGGHVATDGRADLTFGFGSAGHTPIVGHWRSDLCENCTPGDYPGLVDRRDVNAMTWFLETDVESRIPPRAITSDGRANIVLRYGRRTDQPVVGDWDGNRVDDLGVVRQNLWLLEQDVGSDGRARTSTDGTHNKSFRFGVRDELFLSFRGKLAEAQPGG